MSRKEKLIRRLISRPKDYTYDELVTLLGYLSYDEIKKGKTAGSRRAFVNPESKHIIRLHKPHRRNILKMYQIDYLIGEIQNTGVL